MENKLFYAKFLHKYKLTYMKIMKKQKNKNLYARFDQNKTALYRLLPDHQER